MKRTFYYGPDDFSARKIFMNFGGSCFNADIDSLQYSYDWKGDLRFHCTFEFKHPCLKKLDVPLLSINRAVAAKLEVPLYAAIYFTKPLPENGEPCPPGDGYGTDEQPSMFYVVPANRKALDTMDRYGSRDMWFTPARLARFMHWMRGSNVSAHQLSQQGLSDEESRYHLSTKIDWKGLQAAFKGDPQ